MDINRINDHVCYVDGIVNLGIITNDKQEAVLIDAGIDDSTSRKVKRLIEEAGLKLKGLIVTHAHVDHYGGAAHLVKSAGVKVYAAAAEKSVMETPLLEPLYLFGGAYPPKALRNKFLLAPAVQVDQVLYPGLTEVEGIPVEVVDLAGHSLGQIGIATGGVLFCADAVLGPDPLAKHGIPLNANIQQALDTFERLAGRQDTFVIPCHGEPVTDIGPLVAMNFEQVSAVLATVCALLRQPSTAEELLKQVCDRYGVTIANISQHYLMNLTVMAYVGHLLEQNRVEAVYRDNRQLFSLVTG